MDKARLVCLAATLPVLLSATPIVIDFENLSDNTIVTDQYPGLFFSNAVVLTAGISLNEFEFPPHSGINVASDNTGPISIDFSTPVTSFGGYFTYSQPLTLDAFGSSSAVIASTTAAFGNNEALSGISGSSPDEFLSVNFGTGISTVIIAGNPNGGSFAMDDVTYTPITTAVPEPSCGWLCFVGIGLVFPCLFPRRVHIRGDGGSNPSLLGEY